MDDRQGNYQLICPSASLVAGAPDYSILETFQLTRPRHDRFARHSASGSPTQPALAAAAADS